jgi:enoyl-CoA hydratase/carnithine racemase
MNDQVEVVVSEAPAVLLEIISGVGRIMLNRPTKLNSLNRELVSLFVSALEVCEADETVQSIVIEGSGGNFCAGADIEEMLAAKDNIAGYMEDIFRFLARVEDCPKPVIAQVDGYCLGGGFELAIACDLIVSSDRAQFGLPETRFGMVPGFAIHRLAAKVGVTAATSLLFSRRFTPAPVAHRLGLLEAAVDPAELAEAVASITEHLAQLDAQAVAITKQALRAFRRHTANLNHSAWANEAMFNREATKNALKSLLNGSGLSRDRPRVVPILKRED